MWSYEGSPRNPSSLRAHIAVYAVKRPDGLRTISLDAAICTSILATEHACVAETPPKPNRAHVTMAIAEFLPCLSDWDE